MGPWGKRQKSYRVRLVRVETIDVEVMADGDDDAVRKATQQVWTAGSFGVKAVEVELLAKRLPGADPGLADWSLDSLKRPDTPSPTGPGVWSRPDDPPVAEEPGHHAEQDG